LRETIRTSPGWASCTIVVIWLIFITHPGFLLSGLLGIGFGGLGVMIDRLARTRGIRGAVK
jgi:lipoprotein signal peptidase